jgi:hypothetical protein
MKKTLALKSALILILITGAQSLIFSQEANSTLNLGILSSFEAFTGAGGVANTGGTLTGDAGTNFGAISGTGTYVGNQYIADASTAQCKFDLLRMYIHLNALFVDFPATHTPAFGGETLFPGVYSIPAAGSMGGALTLDGGGDPNAFFVIKFLGAFTVGAGAIVTLTNGTKSSNVFYIADGAISVAAGANVKGTLFSKVGAVGLGANVILEGRMLTMSGAITLGVGATAIAPPSLSTIPVFCEAGCNAAPSLDILGTLSNFTLFAGNGAVANTSISGINGIIAAHAGSVAGYGTSTHIKTKEVANALTLQAKIDLDATYTALMALPNSGIPHTAAFGTGETLDPGVYDMAAGSLGGTIILDAANDPNAIFVMRFAGAFNVGAQSIVILANGAKRCNVFWLGGAGVATGAVNIGAGSQLKGIFISHGGACNSGAGVFLAGRQFSTLGAVNTNTGILYGSPECVTSKSLNAPIGGLPIELLSFTAQVKDAEVHLNWATASEINNDYFNVERSTDGIYFTSISKINGAGNSAEILNYSVLDNDALIGVSYYRLKQTDFDGETNYSDIVAVQFNIKNDFIFYTYPNPFSDNTTFQTTKKLKNATLTVYNLHGHIVKQITNISEQRIILQRGNLISGVYFSRLVEDSILVGTAKLVITD